MYCAGIWEENVVRSLLWCLALARESGGISEWVDDWILDVARRVGSWRIVLGSHLLYLTGRIQRILFLMCFERHKIPQIVTRAFRRSVKAALALLQLIIRTLFSRGPIPTAPVSDFELRTHLNSHSLTLI